MTMVMAVAVGGGFTIERSRTVLPIVPTIEGKAVEGRASRPSYV
jgi:hypothetical protein